MWCQGGGGVVCAGERSAAWDEMEAEPWPTGSASRLRTRSEQKRPFLARLLPPQPHFVWSLLFTAAVAHLASPRRSPKIRLLNPPPNNNNNKPSEPRRSSSSRKHPMFRSPRTCLQRCNAGQISPPHPHYFHLHIYKEGTKKPAHHCSHLGPSYAHTPFNRIPEPHRAQSCPMVTFRVAPPAYPFTNTSIKVYAFSSGKLE